MDSMTAALIKQKEAMKIKVKDQVVIAAAQQRNEFNA